MQALYSCLQNCSQLIQTIEDTGTIMREVRDLEEQVRSGKGNGGRPEGSSVKADNLQLEAQPECLLCLGPGASQLSTLGPGF